VNCRSSSFAFSFTLFGFLYLPVVLIYLRIIPFEFRFTTLIVLTLVTGLYSYVRGYSFRDLGLQASRLRISIIQNLILVAVISTVILVASWLGLIRSPTIPEWKWFFPFYVLISAPSQEFLYRSFVFAEMNRTRLGGIIPRLTISAFTYCFLHIIYEDWITLVATLFMGIVWGYIYERTNNFWGVALSHAILGAISIAVGLI